MTMRKSCQLPVVSCQITDRPARAVRLRWQLETNNCQLFRPGFTLTEILIVIGIIVLMIAIAVPTFNILRGNRSVDAAVNQVTALLGRARSEAIGLQTSEGVFFFRDLKTDRYTAALVRETPSQPSDVNAPSVDVFLDLVHEAEFLPMTPGVGVQLVDDCEAKTDASGQPRRQDDGYIGYNTTAYTPSLVTPPIKVADTPVRYGSVILFDANGRLVRRAYGFRCTVQNGAAFVYTDMGRLLYNKKISDPAPAGAQDIIPYYPVGSTPPAADPAKVPYMAHSEFGLVLFDLENFKNKFTSEGGRERDVQYLPLPPASIVGTYDPTVGPTSPYSEKQEEDWFDANGRQLLVNRYNGTVIVSQ
jgi:prepilin-type N-terminal cleavage/methylation domain-containing protein